MKKRIVRLSVALSIGLIVVLIMKWSLIRQIVTFHPLIVPRIGFAPSSESEARLQDLDYLGTLLEYDRSFDEKARKQFLQLLSKGKEEVETMSPASLYLLAAKAAALADNGHTGINLLTVQREFNSTGARYFHFRDGLYVVRALAENEQLIGARLLEIDGQPIDSVLADLNSYFGGADGWRQMQALLLLESPELLHAVGIANSPTSYTLTVIDRLGFTDQVKLNAEMPNILEAVPLRWPFNHLEA